MIDRRFQRLWQGAVATLMAVAMSAPLFAETIAITTEIKRTMTTSGERFGGCAIGIGVSPADEGLDCHMDRWVTFSCVGEHTSKSNAIRMFDSAQMAFALGRKVVIWVDDTKKHNERCFVSRIDVLQTATE